MQMFAPPNPAQPLLPTPEPNLMKVEFEPEPRRITLLRFAKSIIPVRVKVPGGIRTKLLSGAEAMAALIDAAVTVAPVETVLHCDVTHGVQLDGIVAPALDQSMARLESRIPDHCWA